MFIFLNYNISQAGHWPWATQQPPGKSSSLSLSREFSSPGLPVRLLSRNLLHQRAPRAPGRPESQALGGPPGVQQPTGARDRGTTNPGSARARQCAGVAAPRHPSPLRQLLPSVRSRVSPPSVLMSSPHPTPRSLRRLPLTADSWRRVQPLRLLQEAQRPLGLVALDGLEGDADTALGFILVGFHGGTRARNQGGGGRASEGLRQPPARRGAGRRGRMT